jgi:hypothetical protein
MAIKHKNNLTKVNRKLIDVFHFFLQRDHGFSRDQASKEVELIKKAKFFPSTFTLKDFITYKRTGSKLQLPRVIRMGTLWMSWENALNHASAIENKA